MFGRLIATRAISEAIESWQPSLVYSREMALYPALWSLARRSVSCLELNSDSRSQRARRNSPAALYDKVTRHLYLGAFNGFVFVTAELERVVGSLARTRKMIVIANGIGLEQVAVEPGRGPERVLVFVGSKGHRWHGVDRVLQLAAVLRDWKFEIVGYDKSEIVDSLDSAPNVTFHGFLKSGQYRMLLGGATAGIGSLALDRIGLNEACPLKVREYLAHGLPVIVGYQDTDFPEGAPFLFRVGGEVSQWDIDGLREFLDFWSSRRVSREAIAHVDTAVKESRRIGFFRSLLTLRSRGELQE